MSLATFLIGISTVLNNMDGPKLASLLQPTPEYGKAAPTVGSWTSPWDEIAIQYVLVCSHIARNRLGEAFKEQARLVSLFFRYFIDNRGWTLVALFPSSADWQAKIRNENSECMMEAARIVATAFSNCMTDRTSPPDQSRKWGAYYVAGLAMKCYFKVKWISSTKDLVKALENSVDIPPLEEYPRAHQVTYRYYVGILSFLNEEFIKAEQELTLAFYNCCLGAHNNQRRILAYLIPLRILHGHLPSDELLHRFPVLQDIFAPFVTAIRRGDIAAFDRALAERETRLYELSLWFTLQRTRELCLRGLFRRVWVASGKGTRIPLTMFHCALRISGTDVELEEAECLIANMVYKGFMRGYISHEKQMVVLASTNAFPRAADRPTPFALI
ncbi:hypothetical protein C8J57DRAFT_1672973 [Mycena rebaudengoi]|nr:hypothetical protein C8J57DRAFT_1672973 [Mycena rebaudengoi]